MTLRHCSTPLTLGAVCLTLATSATSASAAERLCDSSFENCRTELLTLIDNERVGLDVAFWFMEDQRYVSHIVNRWKAGVPVRIIIDPRANSTYPLNATALDGLRSAGIPMRKKRSGGIMHWKTMVFAGQNVVEFGSANFSPTAFVPIADYSNYVGETIFYTDNPSLVGSFKRKFDDLWVDTTAYANYANVGTLTRNYPAYAIDSNLNFPPGQDYANRSVKLYAAETRKIDVMMYRITDRRHSDAMLAAIGRGVPVRLITETKEYRNVSRLWHAWNVDRMWYGGVQVRVRAHEGLEHEKVVLLYSLGRTIFGSSNWTSASASSQQEHNYFARASWIFQWFADQFERKWHNANPLGAAETKRFVPLPPDKPSYRYPSNGAVGLATTGVAVKWFGGPWAHLYDIYFGADPTPPLLAADQPLGPSLNSADTQSFTLPPLEPGTTYYWKIVAKTAAHVAAGGPIWSFTTSGTPPPTSGATVVLWASNTAAANTHGNWTRLADSSAAGGAAMWNADHGQSKIVPALANPSSYFEQTFDAASGTAYHLWVRLRAQNNSRSNDSVHVQFSDSVTSSGAPSLRIGSSSSAQIVLQDGDLDASVSGWGWSDNGWGTLGSPIYFAANGKHTIRIQQREDGAIVDQIVLSPDTYLTARPGATDNDSTILRAS